MGEWLRCSVHALYQVRKCTSRLFFFFKEVFGCGSRSRLRSLGARTIASGTSCRHQIADLTNAHPKHMAELLADAIAQSRLGTSQGVCLAHVHLTGNLASAPWI